MSNRETLQWASDESGIPYVTAFGMRLASGKVVRLAELPSHECVNCSEYSEALASIDALISMAAYSGLTVNRVEACAAVWSVPDGAPLAMALDNVGCELHPDATDKMERWAAQRRATVKAFRAGSGR